MQTHERNFTYYYTTNALGLGGVLKHPDGATTIVPSLASVVLPSSGGEGFSEVTNYNQRGVSFSNARSSVLGYDSDYRTFTTRADAYITNLNLFGRLKADILQTSIISTREVVQERDLQKDVQVDLQAALNPDAVRFSMHAMIRGLTIDGVEVIPELDLELCECRTYKQLAQKLAGRIAGESAHQSADTCLSQDGPEAEEQDIAVPANATPIFASCFRDLHHQRTDKLGPKKGFKLPVKDFGNVYFGELIVKPGTRHVNLLRIEFDSPHAFGKSASVPKRKGSKVAEKFLKVQAMNTGGAGIDAGQLSNVTAEAQAGSTYDGGTMTVLSHDSNGVPIWPRK